MDKFNKCVCIKYFLQEKCVACILWQQSYILQLLAFNNCWYIGKNLIATLRLYFILQSSYIFRRFSLLISISCDRQNLLPEYPSEIYPIPRIKNIGIPCVWKFYGWRSLPPETGGPGKFCLRLFSIGLVNFMG